MNRFPLENIFAPSADPGSAANNPKYGIVRFRFEPAQSAIGWTYVEIWNPFHSKWSIVNDIPGNTRRTTTYIFAEASAIKVAGQYAKYREGKRVRWHSVDWLCTSDVAGVNPGSPVECPVYEVVRDRRTGQATGIRLLASPAECVA